MGLGQSVSICYSFSNLIKPHECFQILSQQKTLTPVESLANAGLIDAAIMGYKLGSVNDNDNDGEITFGCVGYSFAVHFHL